MGKKADDQNGDDKLPYPIPQTEAEKAAAPQPRDTDHATE